MRTPALTEAATPSVTSQFTSTAVGTSARHLPQVLGLVMLAGFTLGCGGSSTPGDSDRGSDSPAGTASPASQVEVAQTEATPRQVWWNQLQALCGKAFAGSLVSTDEADADLAEEPMTMHVRTCEATRIEIPFHIGDNRSRTWILMPTTDGIHLQHDHRHEDGSKDAVTLYGGISDGSGTATALYFPVDSYSREMFAANDLMASRTNIWTMEVIPGERFSYHLRREGRHFQVDFDLSEEVEAPPAPWGWE